MTTLFDCPYCQQQVPVREQDFDEQVICTHCMGVFRAPMPASYSPLRRASRVTRRPSRGYNDDRDRLSRDPDHYTADDYWAWRRRKKNRYYNSDDLDDDRYSDDDDDIRRDRERRRQRRLEQIGLNDAVTSLVLGIISVLVFCFWPIGGITSCIGFVFGLRGLRTNYHKMAIWGLVLSFVGIVFASGFAMLTIVGVSMFDRKKNSPAITAPAPPLPFFPKVS